MKSLFNRRLLNYCWLNLAGAIVVDALALVVTNPSWGADSRPATAAIARGAAE